jgi:3-hydroxybutyryl-CoA dehydrogenase
MAKETADKVLLVGVGLMGNTIAQSFAMAGIDVVLFNLKESSLQRAMGRIQSGLATLVDSGKLTEEAKQQTLSHIHCCQNLAEAANGANFVMEIVPEVPATKKEMLAQIAAACSPDTVIASNTSALNIFEIADIPNPERLVIAHYYSPAHIVPLVEVVPGPKTSAETVARTVAILEKAGKSPVTMKRFSPGFIVNRIQKAIGETCLDMIESGVVDAAEIDRAVKLSLGGRLPIVGVVQTLDFQGLDMLLDTMRNYGKVYSFVEKLVEQGRLGAKNGHGIYDYQGRSEAEILRKRDELYLKMFDYLKEIHAFDPV